MSYAIRVLITDDHAIVRDGLHLILETTDHIVVVGEAANGRQALERVDDLQPASCSWICACRRWTGWRPLGGCRWSIPVSPSSS